MSSRSRRSLRNSGEQHKKNEVEELKEETQRKTGLKRRSQRTSPKTISLSPPSKLRCLRTSPSSSQSQKPKTNSPVTRRTRRNCTTPESTTNGRNSKTSSPKQNVEKSTNGNSTRGCRQKNKATPKKNSPVNETLKSEVNISNGSSSKPTTPVSKRSSRKRQRSPKDPVATDSPVTRKSRRTKLEDVKIEEHSTKTLNSFANGHETNHASKLNADPQKRKLITSEPVVVLHKKPCIESKIMMLEKKLTNNVPSSHTLKPIPPVPVKESSVSVILPMKETFAENLLEEIMTNHEQKTEVLSLIPEEKRNHGKPEIVKFLVEKLLSSDVALKTMTSPRFNKFLRSLLHIFCSTDSSVECKHLLCESALEWAGEKKSINLKHEIETSLMNLYYDTKFYRKAEETANALYGATKKLQDKEKNVQACLCLSKTYHAMGNISKARANITTAKTEALKIYTPPDLQAELDLQSGIMQIAEEKDMETAFSYFKEAATGSTDKAKRSRALKYMLLSKLLVNRPEEGEKAVQTPAHIKDIDEGVEALLHITKAAISSSLTVFTEAVTKYESELKGDLVVKQEIEHLYSKMLEKNLITIIQPYSRMQITCIAEKIGLPCDEIEKRLSQLILDGQLQAQLDHRDNCLYVYQPEVKDSVYPSALETISHLDRSLSLLNRKVKQLL